MAEPENEKNDVEDSKVPDLSKSVATNFEEEPEPKKKTIKEVLNDVEANSDDVRPFINLTEKMKEHFIESILDDKPYMQRFSIIPNKYEIVFKTMRLEEMGEVNMMVSRFSEDISGVEASHVLTLRNLEYSIYAIFKDGKEIDLSEEKGMAKYLNGVSGPSYDRITKLYHIFIVFVDELKKECFSPDF